MVLYMYDAWMLSNAKIAILSIISTCMVLSNPVTYTVFQVFYYTIRNLSHIKGHLVMDGYTHTHTYVHVHTYILYIYAEHVNMSGTIHTVIVLFSFYSLDVIKPPEDTGLIASASTTCPPGLHNRRFRE